MLFLWLFVYTLRLVPLANEPGSLAFRSELIAASMAATPFWFEWRLLLKIASVESGFREDVGRCRVLSSDGMGARTAWQIIPLSRADSILCVAPLVDAVIAIDRVYESQRMCWRNVPSEQLAAYATGGCDSELGKRLSRQRWP